jgi:hypothetical protein
VNSNGEHHVARIDDTVTAGNLHERAEAVAVPDFNYLEQTFEAIAIGLSGRRASTQAGGRSGSPASPAAPASPASPASPVPPASPVSPGQA